MFPHVHKISQRIMRILQMICPFQETSHCPSDYLDNDYPTYHLKLKIEKIKVRQNKKLIIKLLLS